ncbi:MAG: hypothetical protein ACP5Q5_09900, partial [Brevinematia bacterium]
LQDIGKNLRNYFPGRGVLRQHGTAIGSVGGRLLRFARNDAYRRLKSLNYLKIALPSCEASK